MDGVHGNVVEDGEGFGDEVEGSADDQERCFVFGGGEGVFESLEGCGLCVVAGDLGEMRGQ